MGNPAFYLGFIVQLGFQLLFVNLGSVVSQTKVSGNHVGSVRLWTCKWPDCETLSLCHFVESYELSGVGGLLSASIT